MKIRFNVVHNKGEIPIDEEIEKPLWFHKNNPPIVMVIMDNLIEIDFKQFPKIDKTGDSDFIHIR